MAHRALILIVDDEPNVTRTLKMVFEGEGYDVLAAYSCTEALGILNGSSKLDVVITDLNMERADIGLEVARAAKLLKPPAGVIVCTGYANLENTKASLNLQVDYLAAKPTDLDELRSAVRDIIQRRIAHQRTVEKMKDEFVSIVSHELRTPLTSLRLSLGLLGGGRLGEVSDAAKKLIFIARSNTARLIRLLDSILDVQRLESGLIALDKRDCNISDLINEAAEVMRPIAEESSVSIEINSTPLHVWADPDRVVQTLTNLLSNAIKFSSKHGQVSVRAELKGELVVVRVADEGRGIPSENLELIFERFQQVDTSDSREKGGVGLGLAICRSIVQQHGGTIWAESTLGKGSTFSFTLALYRSL